ncbi:MAG: Crp/Fnr family transcriptional regulator [Clostridiales bacterium]|nr:Crp/Fnr family transcriptional regulator [Clostridiales bacterium]
MRTQVYKPNSLVNQEVDDKIPGVQIVSKGVARVYMSSPEGRQITLQRIMDNEIFVIGVSCVLDKPIVNVILEAETKCEIALIPRDVFKRLFDKNSEVKNTVISMISARFTSTIQLMEKLFFSSVGSRLASALIEKSSSASSNALETTHARIASDIGTSREVVTRILNKFVAEGWVSLRRGWIVINNYDALYEISGKEVMIS